MVDRATAAAGPLGAEAERNRRRLLDAAAGAFAEHGIDVGVAEIARRAGVGQGTLFRHFPTKDDLVAAIALDRIREMTALATDLLASADEPDPLQAFMERALEAHSRDRTLFEAVGCGAMLRPEMVAAKQEMEQAVGALVKAGRRSGQVRDDVVATDVLVLLHGVLVALEDFNDVAPRLYRRYAVLVRDALRPEGASHLPARPATGAEREAVMSALAARCS
jgi:AcrR family transcriptional regulator